MGKKNWGIGSPANIFSKSVVLDDSNNVYTTGGFGGLIDFDPNAGTYLINDTGNVFILKLDANGNFNWAINMNGMANSIAIDTMSNLYVTGSFAGSTDLDPDTLYSNWVFGLGYQDVFIAKYDSYGNFIWGKSIGDTIMEIGRSIDVDQFNNVYVTGYFMGTVDFDPSLTSSHIITSASSYPDIFIVKLDSIGEHKWSLAIGAEDFDYGDAIIADKFGDVYTTGHFRDTVDFDPGTNNCNMLSDGGTSMSGLFYYDIFILKLNECQTST